VFCLGRGSNVLIDDAGLPGLTLHLAGGLQWLRRQDDCLRVGAGLALPRLARRVADMGFGGFEFLAGIPGTVGGAVRLNAGAWGRNLGLTLRRVWAATPQLHLLELPVAALGLGYRTSRLLQFPHWLVVEAELALDVEAPPATVHARMKDILATRQARLPSNPKSCGSVFKNPLGAPPAGRLIEAAGLKGRRRGGALVSRKHANFILNQGGATAADVKALIADIQEAVWRVHGVALQREVIFLPDDQL
jgi:UDP-N-acetylmuramate dehydrogenase